jgi:hypothetical protein
MIRGTQCVFTIWFDDLMEKFIGIHFLLQQGPTVLRIASFCCKNSAGSVSRRFEPTGAAEFFQTKTERISIPANTDLGVANPQNTASRNCVHLIPTSALNTTSACIGAAAPAAWRKSPPCSGARSAAFMR